MYDVLYFDDGRRSTLLASGLAGDAAAGIAREEARRRHAARMFGTGSEPPCQGRLVLIVESAQTSTTTGRTIGRRLSRS